jgi:hypothetical protein
VQSQSVDVGSPSFDDYLRSVAFLNAAHFPSMDFVSNSVEKVNDHTVRVTGELTLLGVTRPLSVDVAVQREMTGGSLRLAFSVKTTIDRLAFGMNSGSGFPSLGATSCGVHPRRALRPDNLRDRLRLARRFGVPAAHTDTIFQPVRHSSRPFAFCLRDAHTQTRGVVDWAFGRAACRGRAQRRTYAQCCRDRDALTRSRLAREPVR